MDNPEIIKDDTTILFKEKISQIFKEYNESTDSQYIKDMWLYIKFVINKNSPSCLINEKKIFRYVIAYVYDAYIFYVKDTNPQEFSNLLDYFYICRLKLEPKCILNVENENIQMKHYSMVYKEHFTKDELIKDLYDNITKGNIIEHKVVILFDVCYIIYMFLKETHLECSQKISKIKDKIKNEVKNEFDKRFLKDTMRKEYLLVIKNNKDKLSIHVDYYFNLNELNNWATTGVLQDSKNNKKLTAKQINEIGQIIYKTYAKLFCKLINKLRGQKQYLIWQ